MIFSRASNAFKTSSLISWKTTGKLQQTLGGCIERSGITLHSGNVTKVKLFPELAGNGRYFDFGSVFIPAFVDFAVESPLCTTLLKDGHKIRTVEHLLSALEAKEVDNCRIEIECLDSKGDSVVEVPILDGSAREWVEAIEQVGVVSAQDKDGNRCEKLAPFLNGPMHVWKDDCFVAAFPATEVKITYGINFPQDYSLLTKSITGAMCSIPTPMEEIIAVVRIGSCKKVPAIGCQWFSSASLGDTYYDKHIASARTFCTYEEVERMRSAGLIKGGSLKNALVCSSSKGWLNPPLHFHDEPCRHKVLDLIGDFSLFARHGSQGLPVAHTIAYKGSHSLHVGFVRRLLEVA